MVPAQLDTAVRARASAEWNVLWRGRRNQINRPAARGPHHPTLLHSFSEPANTHTFLQGIDKTLHKT